MLTFQPGFELDELLGPCLQFIGRFIVTSNYIEQGGVLRTQREVFAVSVTPDPERGLAGLQIDSKVQLHPRRLAQVLDCDPVPGRLPLPSVDSRLRIFRPGDYLLLPGRGDDADLEDRLLEALAADGRDFSTLRNTFIV
jgi:hypothetical protein